MGLVSDVWSGLLDLVYPVCCAGCGQPGGGAFCEACREATQPIRALSCHRCGSPGLGTHTRSDPCASCYHPRAFALLRGAFVYEGPIREAIRSLKFGGCLPVANPLAELLIETVCSAEARGLSMGDIPWDCIDLVCPVPLYPPRERARGFNQAALLAEPLARHLDVPYDVGLLKRARDTRPQPGLDSGSRERNVAGAFAAVEGSVPLRDAQVLVVDDVATTGATMSQCAAALLSAGASTVWALALARPYPQPIDASPPGRSSDRDEEESLERGKRQPHGGLGRPWKAGSD